MKKAFVSMAVLAALLAACSDSADDPSKIEGGPQRIATVHDIMADIVMPQADIVWDATAVLTDEQGVHDYSPKTEADWQRVRNAALILAETGNLLAMSDRKVLPDGDTLAGGGTLQADEIQERLRSKRADFVANAGALQRVAVQAIKNIDDKDLKALGETGGQIDQVCETCHLQFWYPPKGSAAAK